MKEFMRANAFAIGLIAIAVVSTAAVAFILSAPEEAEAGE